MLHSLLSLTVLKGHVLGALTHKSVKLSREPRTQHTPVCQLISIKSLGKHTVNGGSARLVECIYAKS